MLPLLRFFHESRLTPTTPEIQLYLDKTCHCYQKEEPNVTLADEARLHHDGRRRKTMLDLAPTLLQSIAALFTTDTYLFQVALPQFLREIAWLEAIEHSVDVSCATRYCRSASPSWTCWPDAIGHDCWCCPNGNFCSKPGRFWLMR